MEEPIKKVIKDPTWYEHIRYFFDEVDKRHMRNLGLELGVYDSVKRNADSIYSQVSQKLMPIDKDVWNDKKIKTFLNWMINGYKKGIPPKTEPLKKTSPLRATRIRKEIRQLNSDELKKLKLAFETIISRDTNDLNGYFVQAGYHWFPGPDLFCQHHVNKYNPWHRAYLYSFENALRSVKGCEDVTLPYWNLQDLSEIPEILKQPPFDKYVLPVSIDDEFPEGYVTVRNDEDYILREYKNSVIPDIEYAMRQTTWENFNGFLKGFRGIISAHDNGHVYFGDTLSKQEVAAFEPMFWFFHCNWDRLWWRWQQDMDATTVEGLISTMNDEVNKEAFTIPVLQKLPPFKETTIMTIDSVNSLDVDYEHPPKEDFFPKEAEFSGSIFAKNKISFNTTNASIRVKGVNRIKIPGSFIVHLMDGNDTIAKKAFFQPIKPEKCVNCIDNKIVDFDFILPIEKIQGKELRVEIEPLNKDFTGSRISQKLVGNPTVNARLLINK